MNHRLSDTLIHIAGCVFPPQGVDLRVTEAEIELPLEITMVAIGDRIELLASAPHSRWQSGFLPPVHRGRLKLGLEEA